MDPTPPSRFADDDYRAIEAVVTATARGRWFLAEYARRNRSAETKLLLGAIERLEGLIREQQSARSGSGPADGADPSETAAPPRRTPDPDVPESGVSAEEAREALAVAALRKRLETLTPEEAGALFS